MALPATAPRAETLGGRIAQARGYAGLSQLSLCIAIRATRKTLGSWEHNHTAPTVPQLLEIARATRFPATWFVEDLDVPNDGDRDDPPAAARAARRSGKAKSSSRCTELLGLAA